MATTKIPQELSSTPGIVDNSNATAVTIDSSENVTFAGAITLPSSAQINASGALYLDSDAIHFRLNNETELMRINSSGNVGIGTNHPDSKLDVTGGDITVNTTGTGFMNFKYSNSSKGTISTDGVDLKITAVADLQLLPTGNVGIGNTAPGELLSLYKTSGTTLVQAAVHSNSTVGFEIKKTNATTQTWRIADGQTANGVLEFYDATNSATRMAIKGNGNVGIGTTSPTTNNLLHIKKAGFTRAAIEATGNNQSGLKIIRSSSDYDTNWEIYSPSNSTSLRFYGGGDRLTLLDNGNVGIGTTNPAQNFVVAAATNGIGIELVPGALNYIQAYNRSTSDYSDLKIDAQTIRFGLDNGAERVRIDSSGNVGIGTTSPASILHIEGNTNGYNTSPLIYFGSTSTANAAVRDWAIGPADSSYGNFHIFRGASTGASAVGTSQIAFTIASSGNVGIGDSTPTFKLDVAGTARFTSDVYAENHIYTQRIRHNGDVDNYIGFGTDIQSFVTGNSTRLQITNSLVRLNQENNNQDFAVYSANSDNMLYVDASTDRVGIGTNSPSELLEARKDGGNAIIKVQTGGGHDARLILDAPAASGAQSQIFFDASGTTAGSIMYTHNSGGTNFMTFGTGGSNTERMRINSAGNVGIGITDPDQALEIGAGGKLKLSRADNSRSMLLYTNNSDCVVQSDTDPLHLQSANRMTFATNGASERIRITTAGNVGIGTATPMSHLHVNKDITGSNTDGITIGKVEANGWIDTNEEMGRLSWAASYGSSYTQGIGAYISAKADANWNGTETPTRLGFFTAPEGSTTPAERLRITKDGKVGIGTQNPNLKLHVEEDTDTWIADFKNVRSAGGYGLRVDNTGAGGATDTRYALGVYTPGNTGFFVRNNGYVGIGTTAPVAPLNIKADSGANGIRIAARSSNDHGFISFYASDNTTIWSEISGSAGSLRFYTGASNVKMTIEPDGDVGIGLTDTQGSKLGVAGSLRLSGGSDDLASVTTGTGSIVGSGSITHTIGYAGTYVSGKKWTWTYAATNWKSFHVTLRVSGTAGFSTYEGGGYNNLGGPMDTVEHGNDLGSFEVTRNGQNMIMTYTISTQTIHPFFELTYRQSGGDGSPYMSKLSLVQS